MKKLYLVLIIISTFILSSCGEKVYEDQRMGNVEDKKLKLEYNIYNAAIIDSGYNWYTNYLNNFISSIKDEGYKVNNKIVRSQLEKVKVKKNEIDTLDQKMIKGAIDLIGKDLSKNELDDKEYKKEISFSKSRVEKNILVLKNMLESIENGIKLGEDGSYNESDLKIIKEIQIHLINEYDKKLKKH